MVVVDGGCCSSWLIACRFWFKLLPFAQELFSTNFTEPHELWLSLLLLFITVVVVMDGELLELLLMIFEPSISGGGGKYIQDGNRERERERERDYDLRL